MATSSISTRILIELSCLRTCLHKQKQVAKVQMRRQLVESLLASNYSERVADDECKSKSWKTGNPYLAANIPEGPLMNVTSADESTAKTPFARDHSKIDTAQLIQEEEEREMDKRVTTTYTCPRETIRGSPWEHDFPPPIGPELRVPCRFL